MSQVLREVLQRVGGPVLVVPAQKPTSKGWRFKSLFHRDDGGTGVSVGWVTLDVPDRCTK